MTTGPRRSQEGVTLIEIIVVTVIIALGAAGLGFSINALARTSLRSSAAKIVAAVRYAYNRAVARGTTVRIAFDLPAETFSIEEAHGRIVLNSPHEYRRVHGVDEEELDDRGAIDPWAAAKKRLSEPLSPSMGESVFGPIQGEKGEPIRRFAKVELGRHVRLVRLIVPHEPEPKSDGKGAIHFFSTGYTEHAVLELSDGGDGVYSVEVQPLTGRCKVRDEAYEPESLLDDPDNPGVSEVEE